MPIRADQHAIIVILHHSDVALSDLMCKLTSCGAIETMAGNSEPRFTSNFKTYLSMYAGLNRDRITIVQGWRAMLAGFHISLATLSDEELATLVQLLEFQSNESRSAAISV